VCQQTNEKKPQKKEEEDARKEAVMEDQSKNAEIPPPKIRFVDDFGERKEDDNQIFISDPSVNRRKSYRIESASPFFQQTIQGKDDLERCVTPKGTL
jgi:hypothetical protein